MPVLATTVLLAIGVSLPLLVSFVLPLGVIAALVRLAEARASAVPTARIVAAPG